MPENNSFINWEKGEKTPDYKHMEDKLKLEFKSKATEAVSFIKKTLNKVDGIFSKNPQGINKVGYKYALVEDIINSLILDKNRDKNNSEFTVPDLFLPNKEVRTGDKEKDIYGIDKKTSLAIFNLWHSELKEEFKNMVNEVKTSPTKKREEFKYSMEKKLPTAKLTLQIRRYLNYNNIRINGVENFGDQKVINIDYGNKFQNKIKVKINNGENALEKIKNSINITDIPNKTKTNEIKRNNKHLEQYFSAIKKIEGNFPARYKDILEKIKNPVYDKVSELRSELINRKTLNNNPKFNVNANLNLPKELKNIYKSKSTEGGTTTLTLKDGKKLDDAMTLQEAKAFTKGWAKVLNHIAQIAKKDSENNKARTADRKSAREKYLKALRATNLLKSVLQFSGGEILNNEDNEENNTENDNTLPGMIEATKQNITQEIIENFSVALQNSSMYGKPKWQQAEKPNRYFLNLKKTLDKDIIIYFDSLESGNNITIKYNNEFLGAKFNENNVIHALKKIMNNQSVGNEGATETNVNEIIVTGMEESTILPNTKTTMKNIQTILKNEFHIKSFKWRKTKNDKEIVLDTKVNDKEIQVIVFNNGSGGCSVATEDSNFIIPHYISNIEDLVNKVKDLTKSNLLSKNVKKGVGKVKEREILNPYAIKYIKNILINNFDMNPDVRGEYSNNKKLLTIKTKIEGKDFELKYDVEKNKIKNMEYKNMEYNSKKIGFEKSDMKPSEITSVLSEAINSEKFNNFNKTTVSTENISKILTNFYGKKFIINVDSLSNIEDSISFNLSAYQGDKNIKKYKILIDKKANKITIDNKPLITGENIKEYNGLYSSLLKIYLAENLNNTWGRQLETRYANENDPEKIYRSSEKTDKDKKDVAEYQKPKLRQFKNKIDAGNYKKHFDNNSINLNLKKGSGDIIYFSLTNKQGSFNIKTSSVTYNGTTRKIQSGDSDPVNYYFLALNYLYIESLPPKRQMIHYLKLQFPTNNNISWQGNRIKLSSGSSNSSLNLVINYDKKQGFNITATQSITTRANRRKTVTYNKTIKSASNLKSFVDNAEKYFLEERKKG